MVRIYLDVCCLNRLLNDRVQLRVRQEADAIRVILRRCRLGDWQWVSSEMVADEVEQTPDAERRGRLKWFSTQAQQIVQVTPAIHGRARQLQMWGFHANDSLHLACAEEAGVDVFLTTDDRLLRRAVRLAAEINILVANPHTWMTEVHENEQSTGRGNPDP